MSAEHVIVAIDGPAGSGKSTIAAALASRLAVTHVDTGAFYRAATLLVLRAQADPSDAQACLTALDGHRLERRDGRTLIDGEDVEAAIRSEPVNQTVSTVAAHPPVRSALLAVQRAPTADGGAVVEGRDAGTVVVPEADLKVWLTAAPSERAARRAAQLGRPDGTALAEQEQALRERDERDTAQMRRAQGVVEVDTTERSVDEIVEELAARALRSRRAAR